MGATKSGFIQKRVATPVTAVGTAYAVEKAILLEYDDAAQGSAKLPGGGNHWSHVEIILTVTTPTPTTLHTFLSWDAEGDDIAAGPTQTAYTLQAGLTSTSTRMVVIPLNDICPTAPADQSAANRLYAFVKVDNGEVTITRYRLHWRAISV